MIRITLLLCTLLLVLPPAATADIYDGPVAGRRTVPRYDPDGEFLRSLLVPGWSQYRQGHQNAGVAYGTIAVLALVFVSGAIDVPWVGSDQDDFGQVFAGAVYGMNAMVSAFDARRRAMESNREYGWDLPESASAGRPGASLTLVRLRF